MNASTPEHLPPFLTAEWRHLVMLNYETDADTLAPYLPPGTELDPWQGKHLVSMAGFRFLNTRVLGLPIPWHRDFDEVNLRASEYEVEHPPWRIMEVKAASFAADVAGLYGADFGGVLTGAPASAVFAEGSAVTVRRGRRLA